LPLPDATPDKRIYELLKTVDLENLTFADFQGVAKTIYAEQGAEDELRRIVLVNLARLAVKGNWDGLTSSGGGGGGGGVELVGGEIDNPSTYKYWAITQTPPYGVARTKSTSKMDGKGIFFPFVASQTGDLTAMRMRVATSHFGGSFYAGIYSADGTTGLPKDLQGYVTFSTASTGTITNTSFSSTISTTRGTVYWLYCNVDGATTASNLVFYGQNTLANGPNVTGGPFDTISTNEVCGLRYSSATYGVPASSVTTSDLEANIPFSGGNTGDPPTVLVAWT
tara:strand:- start:1709 stop:2551 length:843 start_codon:yes stop_codon:yes gene_type:complete